MLSWLAVQTASAGPFAPIGVLDDHGRGGSADRRRGTLVQRMLPRWDAGAGYGGLIGSDGHRLFVGYANDWDGMIDVLGPDRGE